MGSLFSAEGHDSKESFEANALYHITVIREDPTGSSLQMSIFVDPVRSGAELKQSLSTFTCVPADSISLSYKSVKVEDELSLQKQSIDHNSVIVFRDRRLHYKDGVH